MWWVASCNESIVNIWCNGMSLLVVADVCTPVYSRAVYTQYFKSKEFRRILSLNRTKGYNMAPVFTISTTHQMNSKLSRRQALEMTPGYFLISYRSFFLAIDKITCVSATLATSQKPSHSVRAHKSRDAKALIFRPRANRRTFLLLFFATCLQGNLFNLDKSPPSPIVQDGKLTVNQKTLMATVCESNARKRN